MVLFFVRPCIVQSEWLSIASIERVSEVSPVLGKPTYIRNLNEIFPALMHTLNVPRYIIQYASGDLGMPQKKVIFLMAGPLRPNPLPPRA